MKQFVSLILTAILLVGCAARPLHPGTANAFDSSVFDSLIVTHSVIESTKDELAKNSFSPNIAGDVKTALNKLITVYNDTDRLYCNPPPGAGPTDSCAPTSYHALAMAGQTSASAEAAMRAKANDMNNAVSALATAKGGSK